MGLKRRKKAKRKDLVCICRFFFLILYDSGQFFVCYFDELIFFSFDPASNIV